MINNFAVKNWAEAIFQIYNEKHKVLLLEEECIGLLAILNNTAEYIQILGAMKLDVNSKKAILKEAFEKHLSIDLFNAISLMIDKEMGSMLVHILKKIIYFIDESLNVKHGIVYSVVKLNSKQIKILEEKLSAKLKIKVKLINRIKQSLIGGIKIIINQIVFDYSISSQLKELEMNITNSYS